MFDNLNWWEIAALLMLALLIFGERLPKVIGDGLRLLRNLRQMAQGATADLSRELGTDIQLQDLHPKAFIRKHVLSEDDEAAIRKPLQNLFEDVKSDVNGVKTELNGVKSNLTETSASSTATTSTGASTPAPSTPVPAERPAARTFDLDAT